MSTLGYTISKGSRAAASAGSTSATDVTLTITPSSGFTISASDFSHGTLPAGIDDVTFSNTGVPYSKDNTVIALVDINASYAMPSADTTLDSKITGTARRGVLTEIDYCVSIQQDTDYSRYTTSTVTASGSSATNIPNTVTKTTVGSRDKYKFLGKVPVEPIQTATSYADVTKIGEWEITCDMGYHLDIMPSLDSTTGQPLKIDKHVFLVPKSQVVNSVTNLVSAVTYEIMYKNTKIVEESNQIFADLKVSAIADPSLELQIIHFYNTYYHRVPRGDTRADVSTSKYVNPDGTEKRLFFVVGNIGARFNLRAVDDAGNHLFEELKNKEITQGPRTSFMLTEGGSEGVAFGSDFFTNQMDDGAWLANAQSIGAHVEFVHFESVDTNTNWYFQLTPGDNTTLGEVFNESGIDTLTLFQAFDPVIEVTRTISGGHDLSGAVAQTVKGLVNKQGEEVANVIRGFDTVKSFSWVIARSGGGNFTVIKTPEQSDFTNTDSTTNGGTEVRFKDLAITGDGTATITITGRYVIDKFGDKDVSMNLNLDNIIS
tara:strand:- start:2373 stop:4004 length:1632 start_codon:yes stop_codon:yes gene_type:complete